MKHAHLWRSSGVQGLASRINRSRCIDHLEFLLPRQTPAPRPPHRLIGSRASTPHSSDHRQKKATRSSCSTGRRISITLSVADTFAFGQCNLNHTFSSLSSSFPFSVPRLRRRLPFHPLLLPPANHQSGTALANSTSLAHHHLPLWQSHSCISLPDSLQSARRPTLFH